MKEKSKCAKKRKDLVPLKKKRRGGKLCAARREHRFCKRPKKKGGARSQEKRSDLRRNRIEESTKKPLGGEHIERTAIMSASVNGWPTA